MAITLLPGLEYIWPAYPAHFAKTPLVMDEANNMYANSGRIHDGGIINKIHIPIVTVVQAPNNGIKVSFQGRIKVGSDIEPDGTPTHYRVIPVGDISVGLVATELITDDGTDNGAKKIVSVDDWLTVVFEYENFLAGDNWSASWIPAGGNVTPLTQRAGNLLYDRTGGGWLGNVLNVNNIIVIEYANGRFEQLGGPVHGVGSGTSNALQQLRLSISNPREAGAKFVAPYNGKIAGVIFWANVASNFTTTLYDSNDNALDAYAMTFEDKSASLTAAVTKVWFDIPQTVIAGNTYRLVFDLVSAGILNLYYHDYPADMAADLIGGSDFMWTQRPADGPWTDTPTRKPLLSPFYSELYDTAALGGIKLTAARTSRRRRIA